MQKFFLFILSLCFVFSVCGQDYDSACESGLCAPCHLVMQNCVPACVYHLCGKVRIIEPDSKEWPDIVVHVCKPGEGADLIVKWLPRGSKPRYECGYWVEVDSGEDFTIRFSDDYWQSYINIRYGDPADFNHSYGTGPWWGQF